MKTDMAKVGHFLHSLTHSLDHKKLHGGRRRFFAKPVAVMLFLLVMMVPVYASAVELLTNGSFETGDLTGWTQDSTNAGVGVFTVLQNGEAHPKFGTAPVPSAGLESAMTSKQGQSTFALYQDITIPAGATAATLSFDWGVTENGSGADSIRADITTQSADAKVENGGSVLTNIIDRLMDAGSVAVWQNSVTDVLALAGQDVRIRFWQDDAAASVNYFLDNVSLDYTVAPSVTNYTLDVTVSGDGMGTIYTQDADGGAEIDCNPTCSAIFPDGTWVELFSWAQDGSEFKEWGGECAGVWRGDKCGILIDSNKSVTGRFDLVGTSGPGNGSPVAPTLLEPADGATLRTNVYRDAEITFKWNKSSDPDGDEVSYKIWICADESFAGCDPVNINSDGTLAGLMGVGLALFGFGFIGRRKVAMLMVAGMLMAGGLTACSSSSNDETVSSSDTTTTTPDMSNVVSYSTTLSSGTYFWKVTAVDTNGGATDSRVGTFTVAQ